MDGVPVSVAFPTIPTDLRVALSEWAGALAEVERLDWVKDVGLDDNPDYAAEYEAASERLARAIPALDAAFRLHLKETSP